MVRPPGGRMFGLHCVMVLNTSQWVCLPQLFQLCDLGQKRFLYPNWNPGCHWELFELISLMTHMLSIESFKWHLNVGIIEFNSILDSKTRSSKPLCTGSNLCHWLSWSFQMLAFFFFFFFQSTTYPCFKRKKCFSKLWLHLTVWYYFLELYVFFFSKNCKKSEKKHFFTWP